MAYSTIDDPSAHFQVVTWTGDGSSLAVVNDGNSDLQPDLIWIKEKSNTSSHQLYDSTRGTTKSLSSDDDTVEGSNGDALTAFNSDGFTQGGDGGTGQDGETYVGWQWKANGGSTTTNDASATGVGGLDSVYQANTTAGFSIVTYTGSGSNTTVAHGLGNIPEVIIFKKRTDDVEDWLVYHHTQGNTAAGKLNTSTVFETGSSTLFDSTTPTSTVFSIRTNGKVNDDTDTYVTYCFSEVQGYSKFGKYIGNGNINGPFIYLGFKPSYFMWKGVGSGGVHWRTVDNARYPSNLGSYTPHLSSNQAAAEATDIYVDFLSNGVKVRNTDNGANTSGDTYVYMAFAENPFVTSGGVPATAR